MSTIKSSDEHLTLNADGSSKDIKFQANGVEKASISSAGAFTSTTIDATKLTGTIPNFTSTGIDDNADATAITINSSEQVGIGTASPQTILSLDENTDAIIGLNRETSSGNGGDLQVRAGAGRGSGNSGGDLYLCSGTGTSSADVGKIQFGRSSGDDSTMPPDETWMVIENNGTIRLVAENPATALSTSNAGWEFIKNGPNPYVHHYTSGTGAASMILFLNDNGQIGRIKTSGSSTLYETSSDYRLKENVDYTWDATARLKQLKPARFNFIADDTTTVDGFLAHEVSSVVPEAISGEKDAVDVDGNPDYQGIDQSKLVPLLVKTIQELEARITALEA